MAFFLIIGNSNALLRCFTGEIVVRCFARWLFFFYTITVFPSNEIRDEAKSQKNGPLGMMRIIRVRM